MNFRSVITPITAAVAVSLCLGVSAPAQSPNPSFPVGKIAVYPTLVASGVQPLIVWSSDLPEGAETGDYVLFITQIQMHSGVKYSLSVPSEGEQTSPISLEPLGSQFELWAVREAPATAYLLDTTVAGPYLPMAAVNIRSEDPYPVLPRTRADRPFHVDVTVNGIIDDPGAPDHSRSVTLSRHAQSYGATGTGDNLDRDQATFLTQTPVTANGSFTTTFEVNVDPGADPAKVRGEERLTVYSVADDQMPESVISSRFVQVWPVADGSITGITQGQWLGTAVPELTLALNDLYPDSTTYAQVYQGSPQEDITGTIVPGSSITVNDSVPADRILSLEDYGAIFDSDGIWTLELLTRTPFGTDRLARVSFMVGGSGIAMEDWRQIHFGSSDNSGHGADLHDFDHDGLPNLVEYAFGLDPKRGSGGLLPAPQRSGNHFAIGFTQPAGVSGIVYGAEWSTSLLPDSWLPITDTAISPDHLFSVPIDDHPRLYLRLKVTGE